MGLLIVAGTGFLIFSMMNKKSEVTNTSVEEKKECNINDNDCKDKEVKDKESCSDKSATKVDTKETKKTDVKEVKKTDVKETKKAAPAKKTQTKQKTSTTKKK